jgi:YegS/Rv2252/BmrU family lipid kinase
LKKRFAIIVNPIAGKGRTIKHLPLLKEITDRTNAIFDYYLTGYPKHATIIAKSIFRKYDAIVAFGGDGTVNEVVGGIVGETIPFGVIPDGTGNDFARNLNINRKLDKSVQVLIDFKTKLMDVGTVGSEIFVNGVGIGFDGLVNYFNQKIEKLKGSLSYLYAIFFSLLKWKSVQINIEVDGEFVSNVPSFLVAIGNGISCGGGLKLHPKASIHDSILDICHISKVSVGKVLLNLFRMKDGTIYKVREVHMLRGKNINIQSKIPLPVHFDGEIYSGNTKELRISLVPQSMSVIGNWK